MRQNQTLQKKNYLGEVNLALIQSFRLSLDHLHSDAVFTPQAYEYYIQDLEEIVKKLPALLQKDILNISKATIGRLLSDEFSDFNKSKVEEDIEYGRKYFFAVFKATQELFEHYIDYLLPIIHINSSGDTPHIDSIYDFYDISNPSVLQALCNGNTNCFTKISILVCYHTIYDFLSYGNTDSFDTFSTLILKINNTVCTMPDDLHNDIYKFVFENIKELLIDEDGYAYSPELSQENADYALLHIYKKFNFLNYLDEFGREVILPYLNN